MKLTKSKLKQLIKEELALMGALEIEHNFVRKHGLQVREDHQPDKSDKRDKRSELDKFAGIIAEKSALTYKHIIHKVNELIEAEPDKDRAMRRKDEEELAGEFAEASGIDYNELLNLLRSAMQEELGASHASEMKARIARHQHKSA